MKHLVVAQYREDVSWIESLPADWQVMVVQKDRDVPNTGREASSYLWAILKLYPTLADDDLVGFVQGDPFPHCLDIDLRLLLQRPVDGFLALGEYTFVSGADGHPQHTGLPVAEKYEEWLGKWPGAVRFVPGAQFVVTGRVLKKYPREFYQRLLDTMGEAGPWVLERLWPTMFDQPAEHPRATFYCQATPVTTYLRCELPARYLPGKVMKECVLAQDANDYWYPLHDGAAVFQFAGDMFWALQVHGLQAKGIRVLLEQDDNYFLVAQNAAKSGWAKKKNQGPHSLEGHASIVKWADGCIVTTEHLAAQYRKRNPNVYVCPNTVDPLDWHTLKKPDDGVFRIGWFASDSHFADSKLVRRAMEWAGAQPGVEIITAGFNPTEWRTDRWHLDWMELPTYREQIARLDVAVAPVLGSPWALCRSDLKALEGAMAGAAMVVSDVAPYAPWTHEQNCLKAADAKGFLRHIQRLVRNRDEAKQLAQAGRDYVLQERTTDKMIHLWREAING